MSICFVWNSTRVSGALIRDGLVIIFRRDVKNRLQLTRSEQLAAAVESLEKNKSRLATKGMGGWSHVS
jgi:hypothetical protein